MTSSDLIDISVRDGSRVVTLPLLLVLGALALLVLLVLILWSLKKRRRLHLRLETAESTEELIPSIVGLTHGALTEGNAIKILQNGDEFFPALFDALDRAAQSIHFETYLWKEGTLSDRVVEHLVAAAGRNVIVRVMLDGSGGKITKEQKRALEDGGVSLSFFHPFTPGNIGRINNRDHRKIVVVDGKIGFVGGHCITDDWLGNAEDKKHFRDISVRVEGPIVAHLQSAFSENWVEQTGEVPAGVEYFPGQEEKGDCRAHLAFITPAGSHSTVELLHYVAIHSARRSILIQNPYFLPDPHGIDALGRAVERGVDVRVMVPSIDATDNPLVQHAGHHKFGAILKRGIRIWEYERTLLHQKVMTVDGVWSAVGSTNFDDRSFEINDEVSMGIVDAAFAKKLEEIFAADCEHAREVTLDEWKKRTIGHRLIDGSCWLLNEQL